MSDAALSKMIRTCRNLATALPTIGNETIKAASVTVDQMIPRFWPTYRAGIDENLGGANPYVRLDGGKIESAVHPAIIAWAQKVFPPAGKTPPLTPRDYVYDVGGAYPLAIERTGSPSYPGNRAVGAGAGVWLKAQNAAKSKFNEIIKKATT